MKKLLWTLAIGLVIVSCKKEGESTETSSIVETKDLNQQELDASYVIGVTLGQRSEQLQARIQGEDSLDLKEVKKGLEDFLKSPEDKNSYYHGVDLGKQVYAALKNDLFKGHLSKDEIVTGLMDYLDKKDLKISVDSVSVIMDKFYNDRMASQAEGNAKEGLAYLNKIKKESGVQVTESGLVYKVIQEGTGDKVKIGDKVKVKYTGKTIDDKVFDSTDKNNGGEAIEFPLQEGGLIPGWIEGLQLMSKGSKYTFYIPAELAYGNQQSGPIAPGSTLIFEIEIVDITTP